MLELLAAATKLLLYVSAFAGAGMALAAASLGARLTVLRCSATKFLRISAAGVMLSSIAVLVILVLRLGGDFSSSTLLIILDSPTGVAVALQLVGALALLLTAGMATVPGWLPAASGLAILASFGVNGHAASISLTAASLAWAHVCAGAWWFGAVLLLLRVSKSSELQQFRQLVETFSTQALVLVGLLVAAGACLVLTLVNFNRPDWFTAYAQVLTLKVASASAVLALAAFNKLSLTPGLADEDGRSLAALRRSMRIELALFGAVLAATAILTTYTSPHT